MGFSMCIHVPCCVKVALPNANDPGIWCESVQGYSGYMAVFASDFAMADLGETCLSRIVSTALVVHLAMPGGFENA